MKRHMLCAMLGLDLAAGSGAAPAETTLRASHQFPGALPGIEGPVSGPSRLPDVKPPCLKLAPEGFPSGVFFCA